MKRLSTLLILLLLASLFLPASSTAQNRLALEIGPFLPMGDLGDTHDTSLYIGGRWEMQRVNPLGQIALLSFFLRGGYGGMNLDSAFEAQLDDLGQSTSSSFFDAGVGARVYSSTMPLFVSVGAGFANFDGGGDADSESGVEGALGVGISRDIGGFIFEVEGRGHLVVLDPDNIQFFTLTAGFGLPF